MRQQTNQQDGICHGLFRDRVGLNPVKPIKLGIEEGLQIDQHRVFAGRNQILQVEVGRIQGIEKRQIGAETLIETLDFVSSRAWLIPDVLDPPVRAAIQYPQRVQRRLAAAPIEPDQQFLKMHIDGQRLGLVDNLKTRIETGNHHGAATAMGVARSADQLHQQPRVAARAEAASNRLPVGAKALEELETYVAPLADTHRELAGQHGIVRQDGYRLFRLAQAPDEALKTLFGGIATQQTL